MQQMIRTTIPLPVDIHREWRLEAVRRGITLGDIVLEKTGVKKAKQFSVDTQIKKAFTVFSKASRSGVPYDAAKAVREDRDRDNAQNHH